jgi:hypothetical protein
MGIFLWIGSGFTLTQYTNSVIVVHVKKKLSPGAALAAMRKTFKGGRTKVMSECPRCGKLCSARERRAACPAHKPKE